MFYRWLENVSLPLALSIYPYVKLWTMQTHKIIKVCYWKLNWHCLSMPYSTYILIRIIIYVNETKIKIVVKLSRVITSLLSVSFFITVSNVIYFKYNWNQYLWVFIIRSRNLSPVGDILYIHNYINLKSFY